MAEDTHYLFDFQTFIEELRNDNKKKEIIEKYEKFVLKGEKIQGDVKDQKWYKDYLSKFQTVPSYKVPEDLENRFDWTLLFQLVAGSFSSYYRLFYNSSDEERKVTVPDLFITVQIEEGGAKIEKTVSELWSFQILRLFEIYIEEQINLEIILNENDTLAKDIKSLKRERRNTINKYKNLVTPPTPLKQKNKKTKTTKQLNYNIGAHYCSLESAFHIIEKGSIFASDLTYMNDASELTFGIEVLMTALKEIVTKKSLSTSFKDWLQQIINNDVQLRNGLEQAPVYIACFCHNDEDNLNQWRAYGDNGNGICLVFDFSKTEGVLAEGLSDGFYWDKVTYLNLNDIHNNAQWKRIKRDIEKEFEIIYKKSKKANIDQLFHYLTPKLRRYIRYYKNEKFHEEKELRQVCLNIENDDTNYKLYKVESRFRGGYIIPYINLNLCNTFGESAITKIIIGPSVKDFMRTKRSFERFITELNKKKAIERVNILCRQTISQLQINSFIMTHIRSLRVALKEEVLIIEPTRERVLQKAHDAFNKFFDAIKTNLNQKDFTKISESVKKELDSINSHVYIKLEKSDNELKFPDEERSIIRKSVIPYIP